MKAIQLSSVKAPLSIVDVSLQEPSSDEVLVKVAGCGVCHTDIGFWKDGVPTKKELPLTLGHEISGVVEKAGDDAKPFEGKEVLISAVISCGKCALCRKGRGNVCRAQIMPGNDIHGGFAEYITVPARGICLIEDKGDYQLEELSVVADAVTTPYQAVLRSGLEKDDLAIVTGVGGVGGYCVQLAHAFGAKVVAIDVDDAKLEKMKKHGADLVLNSGGMDFRALKKSIKEFAKAENCPSHSWKIFECSGHPAGQETAVGLLTFASTLMVVGFTLEKISLRLSNLMAFDATLQGTWGCKVELYAEALKMVTENKIDLKSFIQVEPMAQGPEIMEKVARHEIDKRVILVPEGF
jgi:6-hydroxycyclohex-1-ene-1-carbonyl-CoA dehydrogenase